MLVRFLFLTYPIAAHKCDSFSLFAEEQHRLLQDLYNIWIILYRNRTKIVILWEQLLLAYSLAQTKYEM